MFVAEMEAKESESVKNELLKAFEDELEAFERLHKDLSQRSKKRVKESVKSLNKEVGQEVYEESDLGTEV